MAQIKQTIELLVKILKSNGLSKVKPEIFRQAKFNQDEATESMWKLLFEVLYYIKYGEIDDITIQAYSILDRNELCIYVKTELKQRGFVARSFHELPNDMSQGSRELLLTLGWLLCKFDVMSLFMNQCCSFLDDESALLPGGVPEFKYTHPIGNGGQQLKDKVSYLMWLNGKLRMNLRNLFVLQQEKKTLTEKAINSTKGVSTNPSQRNHLSVMEILMLKNPQLLKKNLRLLEADNQRLEYLIAWQQHDTIFWKWMESVLDAKISETGLIEEVSDTVTPRTVVSKALIDHKLELTESINKYSAIVAKLEQDILNKRETTIMDLDMVIQSITSDVQTHSKNILRVFQNKASEEQKISNVAAERNSKLQKVKSLKRHHSNPSSITSVSDAEDELFKMEAELSNIQGLLMRLHADIEYKQHNYKEDMTSLSSDMDSLLLETVTRDPIFKY